MLQYDVDFAAVVAISVQIAVFSKSAVFRDDMLQYALVTMAHVIVVLLVTLLVKHHRLYCWCMCWEYCW